MTHPPGEPTAIQACQNQTRLRRMVGDLLAGSGLEIRERDKELVISNPRHPDRGRIYITYAAGEASHARTEWTYLGHLAGHGTDRHLDDDPRVDADLITTTLTPPENDSDASLPCHYRMPREKIPGDCQSDCHADC
jgi:hypothetical protein